MVVSDLWYFDFLKGWNVIVPSNMTSNIMKMAHNLTRGSCSPYCHYSYLYLFRSIRLSITFQHHEASYDIWRHIWGHNDEKSKYHNCDTTIAFLGWKYVKIQIHSSIWSFAGWHYNISMNIWATWWYLTSYVTSQPCVSLPINQNIKILTPPSCHSYENVSVQIYRPFRSFLAF